jgi:hypothetical protein
MKKKYYYLKLALTLIVLPCAALALLYGGYRWGVKHRYYGYKPSPCTLPELVKTPAGAEDALPQQAESDIGHFSLKALPGVQFSIPRDYFESGSGFFDEERLILRFNFSPGMKELVSEKTMHARTISVSIVSKYHLISYWGSAYLGPESTFFQCNLELSPFGDRVPFIGGERDKDLPFSHPSRVQKCLENGKIDPATGLMAYPGKHCYKEPAGGKVCDVMYLPPQADPCNPKEWIRCGEDICTQVWFRDDGCCVVIWFKRTLMPHHADIRKAIDLKLDEFIHIKDYRL